MVSTRRSEYNVNSSKVNYSNADKGYLCLYLYLFMMPLFCIAYHLENKLFIIIIIIITTIQSENIAATVYYDARL